MQYHILTKSGHLPALSLQSRGPPLGSDWASASHASGGVMVEALRKGGTFQST